MQNLNYLQINSKFNNKNNTTVLFLHGWGGNINSFLFVQKRLAYEFNTINLDFYGFGESAEPQKPMDTYTYALAVYELLVKLNVTKLYIVAHSFGGRVAILLSSVFNINVEKLVLVSSAGIKPRHSLLYFLKVYAYKFFKYFVSKGWFSQKVLQRFGSRDYKQLSGIMKGTFVAVVNQHLEFLLPYIKSKTLIVFGKKDSVTPYRFAKVFNKHIKNSKILTYKNSGHFCFIENLGDFCNEVYKFFS